MLDRVTPTAGELRWLAAGTIVIAAVAGWRWWQWHAPAPAPHTTTTPARGLQLDVNTAAWYELDALPGLGETLARRIVDHRAANGRFASLEALARVPGISPAKVKALTPFLVTPE
jgi:competence ComEA-like helix-hairpin-helix protein